MVQHALMTKDELRDALAKLPQVPFAVTPYTTGGVHPAERGVGRPPHLHQAG